MNSESTTLQESKEDLTNLRVATQKRKSRARKEHGKLGEKSEPFIPADIEVMFAAKMCGELLEMRVRQNNIIKAYKRDYGSISKESEERMNELLEDLSSGFESAKRKTMKLTDLHPLWQRLSVIRYFSSYQLGMIMKEMKDPLRFDKASQLIMYAGQGSINGMALTKANINKIKQWYAEQGKIKTIPAHRLKAGNTLLVDLEPLKIKEVNIDDGPVMVKVIFDDEDHEPQEFPIDQEVQVAWEFQGFNTKFAQRLFIITDCFIKHDCYFRRFYDNQRKRFTEKAINEGKAEKDEKTEKYYMKGKNKQSLEVYTHTTAKRKMATVLLCIIYEEWRKLKGSPAREPYVFEYLGHTGKITLENIALVEKSIKGAEAVEKANEKEKKEEPGT